MAADQGKPLKLVRGGSADDAADSRTRTARRRGGNRRTVTRRPPPGRDPVTEILQRLDEEPAEDGARMGNTPVSEPAPTKASTVGRDVLLLVLCAALTAAGYLGAGWYGDGQTRRAHQQAVVVAKQASVDFVSVSAASVDRDLQRILARTTGYLRAEFSRGQSQVRATVVANNVDSRGTVLRAALLSGDRRRATVLVAIDATVRTANAPEGRQSHYRIQVELSRRNDRWLVSRLRFVG